MRRQSIDPADLFHGHVGAMDLCARALLVAERMIVDGRPARELDARYAGWDGEVGRRLLAPGMSLDDVAAHALQRNVDERPVSARQEAWENLVNEYIA